MRVVRNLKFAAIFIICQTVLIPFFNAPAQAASLKKIVAVSRFENKAGYSGQWSIGDGMADQLTDALMRSGQFVVLERQTLRDVTDEQDLAESGRAQKSNSARTGKLTSAQILIKGTVTEFESASKGGGGGVHILGASFGSRTESAHVGLIIRLIDTTTGRVLDSQRVEGSAESTGISGSTSLPGVCFGGEQFFKTPMGKAVQETIDNAVDIIASRMKNIPFQARIVKASGNDVLISAGKEQGVTPDNVFTVYSVGEELVDPDTGELLGSEESSLGTIKVVEVKEKYSKAKAVSGKGYEKGQVVRAE